MKNVTNIKNLYIHDKALRILDLQYEDIHKMYTEMLHAYPNSMFKVNNYAPFNGHFLIIGQNYLITKHCLIGINSLFKYKDYFVFTFKKVNYLTNNVYQVIFN